MATKLKVKKIFIHCSASAYGDVLVFDEWHKKRGWSGVGYHYIILNGRPFPDVKYFPFLDGQIQPGRHFDDDPTFSPDEIGAHVAGRNGESIGICLVGVDVFTAAQLNRAKFLVWSLLDFLELTVEDVFGHYEDPNTNKTCPNIEMGDFRTYLRGNMTIDELIASIADYNKGSKNA